MKKRFFFFAALWGMVSHSVLAQSNHQLSLEIIPEPATILISEEVPFTLSKKAVLFAHDEDSQRSARYFQRYLERYYGIELPLASCPCELPFETDDETPSVAFLVEINPLAPIGAYRIQITPRQIVLEGANPEGLFYAVQTFIQLLPVQPFSDGQSYSQLPIPSLEIEDAPRFAYRGLHLDVVRHIFPVEYIKRYIDNMALHKLNYFHWHLTDDQGWRMESKRRPILNERAAYRESTIIGIFPGTGVDSTRYGGYYTIEEMKEVVAYAAERFITVIPEIDIPGHNMAVLAAYPHFSTTPHLPKAPAITWGIYNRENNVLIPSDEVFAFLKDVFEELMEVFPSHYIHLGGDECAKKWWQESPFCQEFIQKHNLVDEEGMQAYMVRFVADIIRGKGRIPIGWNEIMQGGAPEGAVVMSWRTTRPGVEAAKLGHPVIMTPSRYCYMNISQLREETKVLAHAGYLPIDSVYTFDPVPRGTPQEVAANIIGGQLCMWTEYYPFVEHIEYALFPRLAAASEVFWSAKERRNFPVFMEKLERQKMRYRLWGVDYCGRE